MTNKFKFWLRITDSLIESTTDAYNNGLTDYYSYVSKEINKLIGYIKKSEYGNMYYFSELNYDYPVFLPSNLMSAIGTLRQIKSFLVVASGEDIEIINKLKERNKFLAKELNRSAESEKILMEIIKEKNNSSEFHFSDVARSKFEGNDLKLVIEAEAAFSACAYTACVCICRKIFEKLLQNLCDKHSLPKGSLNGNIKTLVDAKVIQQKYQSQLLEVATMYGNRSAHPTTESFTKEKASLVLSVLAIINTELIS